MKVLVLLALISIAWSSTVAPDYTVGGTNWTGTCNSGNRQSPIDIITKDAQSSDWELKWGGLKKLDDSEVKVATRKIQIEGFGEKTVELKDINGDKSEYELLQFHWHAPSEHKLNGKQYDAEAHFVHKKSDSEYLVIGVFFDTKDGMAGNADFLENQNLEHLKNGYTIDKLKVKDFFNEIDSPIYHYSGSLTTPPCSEVVEWFVFEKPVFIPHRTLKMMNDHFGASGTARNVQNLNGRKVYKGYSTFMATGAGILALISMISI